MTRQEWALRYRRLCAYFKFEIDPAQELEMFRGRFELWDTGEWDTTWDALAELSLSRLPTYGDFASLRRQIWVQNQHKRRPETRTVCADCNGTGWRFTGPEFGATVEQCPHLRTKQVDESPDFNREGLKRFQRRIIETHDATVDRFVKTNPKPLCQVLVEAAVTAAENWTHHKTDEETARRDYQQNQDLHN